MSRVLVVEPDPEWPKMFERIRAYVWPAVSEVALGIEHVGSTSVPGLNAKPVIDACIVVDSTSEVPPCIRGLAEIGYIHRGNLGVPEREAFVAPADLPRHHLYLCPRESLSLKNHLGFRDYLRAHPEAAREYGELKAALARRFPGDMDSYVSGKSEFILQILREIGFDEHELAAIRKVNQLNVSVRTVTKEAPPMTQAPNYLLAGQATELDRLQLQSKVWEPAGRALLSKLPDGAGWSALDVGCGALGWLRILSEWVGLDGQVTGSDFDEKMVIGARAFVEAAGLENVTVVKDDLFASQLPAHSFDLVHARFEIAPLGRADEQLASYRRLLKPGGWIVLEDPDVAAWRVYPDAPAVQRLGELIDQGFRLVGGDINSGRMLPSLLRTLGVEPRIDAHIVALEPGHPYLRLPLQFATALRPGLEKIVSKDELDELLRQAELELSRPGTWGTTFVLIQAYAQL